MKREELEAYQAIGTVEECQGGEIGTGEQTMGRLIDANKLIEQIWKKLKEEEESYDLCVDELKDVFCGIVALVDEQPTVYDPDKVVQQIKELSIRERGEIKTEDVITIVKDGGVNAD